MVHNNTFPSSSKTVAWNGDSPENDGMTRPDDQESCSSGGVLNIHDVLI